MQKLCNARRGLACRCGKSHQNGACWVQLSCCDADAALRASTLEDIATVRRAHANSKSVRGEFVAVIRLIRSLHARSREVK